MFRELTSILHGTLRLGLYLGVMLVWGTGVEGLVRSCSTCVGSWAPVLLGLVLSITLARAGRARAEWGELGVSVLAGLPLYHLALTGLAGTALALPRLVAGAVAVGGDASAAEASARALLVVPGVVAAALTVAAVHVPTVRVWLVSLVPQTPTHDTREHDPLDLI